MCGVVGILSWASQDDTEALKWRQRTLKRLLEEAQSRGRDATGIMCVKDGKLAILKDGVLASDLVKEDKYKKFVEDLPPIVIGHTRAASRGTKNGADDNLNNHPFYNPETGIGIVHNGLVDDEPWRRLAEEKDGRILYPFTGKTDSEAVLRILETFVVNDGGEMVNNIRNTCLNLAGSYALGILREDMPEKMWWVAHTSPLAAGYLPSHKAVVFASTDKILRDATGEYDIILNFFVSEREPKGAIYNTINDGALVEVEVLKKAPWVKFRVKMNVQFASQAYDEHRKRGMTEEVTI